MHPRGRWRRRRRRRLPFLIPDPVVRACVSGPVPRRTGGSALARSPHAAATVPAPVSLAFPPMALALDLSLNGGGSAVSVALVVV